MFWAIDGLEGHSEALIVGSCIQFPPDLAITTRFAGSYKKSCEEVEGSERDRDWEGSTCDPGVGGMSSFHDMETGLTSCCSWQFRTLKVV